MKKDKKWLEAEIMEVIDAFITAGNDYSIGRGEALVMVLDLIDQLDEPEKPVIPQFIADWIEYLRTEYKLSNIRILGELFLCDYTLSNERARLWSLKNEAVLIDALYNDYEVEREPKYLVKVNKQDSWLYLKSMGLYKDVERLTDLNSNLEGWKEGAIKFSHKEQAKSIANFFGGEVEEVAE